MLHLYCVCEDNKIKEKLKVNMRENNRLEQKPSTLICSDLL